MSFSQMLNFLRESHKGIIIFINAGAFYIAVEEDAVFLNSKLQLKCTCFKKNVCKVGVPINSIDNYLSKIEKIGYAYIVYNLNREKRELAIVRMYEGKKHKTERKNINCLLCKGVDAYKDDDYMQALENLYRKQRYERKE